MADNMLADLKKHDAHPSVLSFMESHRAAIELRLPDSFTEDEVRGSQIGRGIAFSPCNAHQCSDPYCFGRSSASC